MLHGVTLGASAAGAGADSCSASLRPFVDYLDRYFAGDDPGKVHGRLTLGGRTEFETRVLNALSEVSFGSLVSYGQLAERVGSPRAARAVGGAVGRNPMPIFIPCHRVIRSDGGLGGFGAGTEWKRALLEHEGWSIVDGKVVERHAADN